MKKATWENPNKMHFESEYKTFNKQAEIITTGNVFANCQTSLYIRPYTATKNGSHTAKPGDFLRYDLDMFAQCGYQIPHHIRQILTDENRKESYILYNFHVWNGREKITIGWIVTDSKYNLIGKFPVYEYGKSYWKRYSAIEECARYVSNYGEPEARTA